MPERSQIDTFSQNSPFRKNIKWRAPLFTRNSGYRGEKNTYFQKSYFEKIETLDPEILIKFFYFFLKKDQFLFHERHMRLKETAVCEGKNEQNHIYLYSDNSGSIKVFWNIAFIDLKIVHPCISLNEDSKYLIFVIFRQLKQKL